MDQEKISQLLEKMWSMVHHDDKPDEQALKFGVMLAENEFGPEAEVHAADFLRYSVDRGNIAAMFHLGMCHRWGEGGVYADPDEALSWFRKAAEGGHPDAQQMVEAFGGESGRLILLMSAISGMEGQGSKWYRSQKMVEEYYAQARAGNAESQYELARQLENPERLGPFKHNIEEAIYWYQESAKQGVVDAMFNLAVIYYQGKLGVAPDAGKAKHWFGQAAASGDQEAQRILNRMETE